MNAVRPPTSLALAFSFTEEQSQHSTQRDSNIIHRNRNEDFPPAPHFKEWHNPSESQGLQVRGPGKKEVSAL